MGHLHDKAEEIARQYLAARGAIILESLGSGTEGNVYRTSNQHAIKIHSAANTFQNELAVYQRLMDHGVRSVCGLTVPQLIDHDRNLFAIEMTIVNPPYLLDFGKSRVDSVEDFPDEVWSDWMQGLQDKFGSRFEDALNVFEVLKHRWGVYYLDINPYNLDFGDSGTDEVEDTLG